MDFAATRSPASRCASAARTSRVGSRVRARDRGHSSAPPSRTSHRSPVQPSPLGLAGTPRRRGRAAAGVAADQIGRRVPRQRPRPAPRLQPVGRRLARARSGDPPPPEQHAAHNGPTRNVSSTGLEVPGRPSRTCRRVRCRRRRSRVPPPRSGRRLRRPRRSRGGIALPRQAAPRPAAPHRAPRSRAHRRVW